MSVITSATDAVGVHVQTFTSHAEQLGAPIPPDVVAEWERAGAVAKRAVERVRFVKASRDYSREGRAARIEAAKNEALTGLAPLRKTVERHRSRLAEIEQSVTAAALAPATDAEWTREEKLRDMIRAKYPAIVAGPGDGSNVFRDPVHVDVLQVEALHKAAVASGDVELQRAIERAPKAFTMLRPEYVQDLQAARLRAHPDYEVVMNDLIRDDAIYGAALKDIHDAIESTS